MTRLSFHAGTLEIRDLEDPGILPSSARWDERTACYRAPAQAYGEVFTALVRRKLAYTDDARRYVELPRGLLEHRTPRPFQAEAIEAWKAGKHRGVVALPTGAGKTWVAMMAIDAVRRSTLVVAPTLDLVRQWYDQLKVAFDAPVGVVGGGTYDVQPLTVITYDSAWSHMEHLGNRFGLVVFDECHHLPGDTYSLAASMCLAPFRLGLSATPERQDGRHVELDTLIGPLVYRRDVVELAGEYLADYETIQVTVPLTDAERAYYEEERGIYRDFVERQGIRFSRPGAWQDFLMRAARSAEGRRALLAWRRQRELAFAAPSKLGKLEELLQVHHRDRVLVFTQDNRTAYAVARRFLIPIITHQTPVPERSAILAGFAEGTYGAVATSKVLNEGVDVPSANVAIVISGSGSVREHVQRLGRILRKQANKQAILYELVAEETGETYTSQRRREHSAYR
jgi:superfamily II DNA or RNA helicase